MKYSAPGEALTFNGLSTLIKPGGLCKNGEWKVPYQESEGH